MKLISGIYCITINNKKYVGSSINISRRIIQHKSDLNKNKHCNKYLQSAFNKHKNFSFNILEECSNLIERELYYIKKLNAEYNLQDPITHFNTKEVYQFNKNGTLICKYENVVEASKKVKLSISNIIHAAQPNEKLTKTAGGYYWSYNSICPFYNDNRKTTIHLYNLEGKYLKSYNSVEELRMECFPKRSYQSFASVVNRICSYKTCSLEGFRFSYIKVNQLDNKLLLKIKQNFPIVQLSGDNIIKTWENCKSAANHLKCNVCMISDAVRKGTMTKGYYWARLGINKSDKLLETLEADNQQPITNLNG